MKQDDIITVTVADYGMNGEGIARLDGYTVFIPFVAVGEEATAKVNYVKKNLAYATLQTVIKRSSARIDYPCNRFMKCGGCDILHLSYDEQLSLKKRNVENLFRKNARIDAEIDDVIPSPDRYGYRNKIQLPFGTVEGRVVLGFYRENSHKVVSITKCFLHGEWAEKLIAVFLEYAKEYHLTAYDDITRKGLLRHLVARYVDGNICIVAVINGKALPDIDALILALNNVFHDSYSLYISPKTEPDNVVMGKTVLPIVERKFVIDVLGVKCAINPFSFLQLNSKVRDMIYTRIADEITSSAASPTVIDAYAGVGTLGAVLARRSASVYNIEIVPEAVADGKALAKANGVSDRVTNICGDAAKELPLLIKRLNGSQRLVNGNLNIILDPPRKGCDRQVLDALINLPVSHKLFYISCNPATLTRDLAVLAPYYRISYVTPYDMFPQTSHVETLVMLNRK